jgi:hypothetical protein
MRAETRDLRQDRRGLESQVSCLESIPPSRLCALVSWCLNDWQLGLGTGVVDGVRYENI